MIRRSVALGPSWTADALESWLRAEGRCQGFAVGVRRSMRTVPGSAHWHLTRGPGSGTLEVTLDPAGPAAVVAVHDNRRGSWAGAAVQTLAETLEGAGAPS